MTTWPKDNQTARNAFYGDPGKGEIAAQMVPVVPPFAMYYEGKRVRAIQFHRKAAPALLAALNEIWDFCQHDQAKVDAAGVSKYAGAYNHRLVRGSKTKWSNHAYAAAIDLNAAENGLYAKGNMPQFVIDAFCRQGWMWGGWYTGRKDPMHFEAVDNGGRQPKSVRPVFGKVEHLLDEPAEPPADDIEDEPLPSPIPPFLQPDDPGTGDAGADDAVLLAVQNDLKAMSFNPGIPNGQWGDMTISALAGFIAARGRFAPAPLSIEDFRAIRAPLLAEIAKAKSEKPPFTRIVSDARASGDAATVAAVAPEVVPVKRNFLTAAWAAVSTFLYGIYTTISGYVSAAWDFFTDHKDDVPTDPGLLQTAWGWITGLPPIVWIIAVGALFGFIALNSRSSAKAITESVSTGARQ